MKPIRSVSQYILKRILIGIVTLWLVSIISFTIIQLPPVDFVSSYIAQLIQSVGSYSSEIAARLRTDFVGARWSIGKAFDLLLEVRNLVVDFASIEGTQQAVIK